MTVKEQRSRDVSKKTCEYIIDMEELNSANTLYGLSRVLVDIMVVIRSITNRMYNTKDFERRYKGSKDIAEELKYETNSGWFIAGIYKGNNINFSYNSGNEITAVYKENGIKDIEEIARLVVTEVIRE